MMCLLKRAIDDTDLISNVFLESVWESKMLHHHFSYYCGSDYLTKQQLGIRVNINTHKKNSESAVQAGPKPFRALFTIKRT